jgi:hypothetical protein
VRLRLLLSRGTPRLKAPHFRERTSRRPPGSAHWRPCRSPRRSGRTRARRSVPGSGQAGRTPRYGGTPRGVPSPRGSAAEDKVPREGEVRRPARDEGRLPPCRAGRNLVARRHQDRPALVGGDRIGDVEALLAHAGCEPAEARRPFIVVGLRLRVSRIRWPVVSHEPDGGREGTTVPPSQDGGSSHLHHARAWSPWAPPVSRKASLPVRSVWAAYSSAGRVERAVSMATPPNSHQPSAVKSRARSCPAAAYRPSGRSRRASTPRPPSRRASGSSGTGTSRIRLGGATQPG